MNMSQLPKIVTKGNRRLGQGHGSGRVKTSGRGQKGQQARHSIPLDFEGGALPLIKRLPFLRGKGKNISYRGKPIIISLKQLSKIKPNSIVDEDLIIKSGLAHKKELDKRGIKILADGEIAVGLTVKLPVSKGARAKIEKAGGKVIMQKIA